jgi:lactoylglutathione lyase
MRTQARAASDIWSGSIVSRDPCPAVAQLELIALATSDVEGLRDFYLQLGAVASPPFTDPDTGLRSCVLEFCGLRLELLERPETGDDAAGDERLVGLGFALGSADAVDELSCVIAAAGYQLLEPPHRTGELGRYESVVLDPDGNRLKLTV